MLSIIIATIASVMIGGIWFGPKTFYPTMMEMLEQSDERVEERMKGFNPPLHFGIVILSEAILASIIYGLLQVANGDMRVIVFPILFVVASNVKTNIFTFLNLKLFLVQEGQKVVSILVMGLIIGLMM